MSERTELIEDYLGGREKVQEMVGPGGAYMVGDDEHAHLAHTGAPYTHQHRGGAEAHVHTVTLEDGVPVSLSPDEPSVEPCSDCSGQGHVGGQPCSSCFGTGELPKPRP